MFAVLPYCQIIRANVIVDFMLSQSPTRVKTTFDTIGNLLYLGLGVLLTWRLTLGGYDMYKYNESFMTIALPRWYSFPYATICMVLLLAVTIYSVARSIAETRAGRFFDDDLNAHESDTSVNIRAGSGLMSGLETGIIGFVVLLALLAVRIPIGVAMLTVGMVGYISIAGVPALLSYLKTEMYWRFNDLRSFPSRHSSF